MPIKPNHNNSNARLPFLTKRRGTWQLNVSFHLYEHEYISNIFNNIESNQ